MRGDARTRTYDDLVEALGEEGCPMCRLALRGVERSMDAFVQQGGVTDIPLRARLRESHGYCNEHAHAWLGREHVLGTAIIYEDVLGHLSAEFARLAFRRRGLPARAASLLSGVRGSEAARAPEPLAPHRECPACRILSDVEAAALDALHEGLRRPEFAQAYAASDGLCLPHLRAALAGARDEDGFGALVRAALARNELLRGRLREVMRKHDYRYAHEPVGEERGSPALAVRHAAGERGIDAPKRGGGRGV